MYYRIILVDDHAMVRQGIKRILGEVDGLEVIAEAGDGQEVLDLLQHTAPDLVIMDVQMPRLGGLEATRRLKARHPEVKVLVLTMHKEKEYLEQALAAGAEGFVLKEDIDQVLLEAIDALRHGRRFISPLAGN